MPRTKSVAVAENDVSVVFYPVKCSVGLMTGSIDL